MTARLKTILAAATLAACGAGHATKLDFSSYTAIGNAGYGDRVANFGSAYGSEGGATPNVVLDFATDSGRALAVYASGYAGLVDALGHSNFNEPGHVSLTPDAGYDVLLLGFDIAGWSGASYPASRIQVLDAAGTPLLDTGLFTFAPNTVLQFPSAQIRSSQALRIVVNDFGDLAIDNLVFGQVASVPDAPPLATLLAGLGVVGLLQRRRSRRGAP